MGNSRDFDELRPRSCSIVNAHVSGRERVIVYRTNLKFRRREHKIDVPKHINKYQRTMQA